MGIDTERLNQLVGKMLGDLGGAASVPMVRIGDTLGLYKALHESGPMTPGELAKQTRIHERYLREWLSFTPHPATSAMTGRPGVSRFRPSRRWSSPSRTAR